jgi:2-iminobutanoate/2-iminopropanoate deaminase
MAMRRPTRCSVGEPAGRPYGAGAAQREIDVSREKIYTSAAPTPKAPYAQAIKANGFLFVTGQVSRDPGTGEFVDGPFEEQLRRSIKNLEAILKAGGSSLGNVTMLTIYMIRHDDLDTMNRVLGELFPDPPARSSFGVGFLWKKCRVMIDAIAVIA